MRIAPLPEDIHISSAELTRQCDLTDPICSTSKPALRTLSKGTCGLKSLSMPVRRVSGARVNGYVACFAFSLTSAPAQ